jgi:hypothetical protein
MGGRFARAPWDRDALALRHELGRNDNALAMGGFEFGRWGCSAFELRIPFDQPPSRVASVMRRHCGHDATGVCSSDGWTSVMHCEHRQITGDCCLVSDTE